MTMIPDELFDLAFEFKSLKPWKKMHPAQFFSVILPDGRPRFCQIFGGGTGKPALWIHNSEESVQAYLRMVHAKKVNFYTKVAYLVEQEAYILTFENKAALAPSEIGEIQDYLTKKKLKPSGSGFYPVFRVTTAQHRAWMYRDKADVDDTLLCLQAVMKRINDILKASNTSKYILDLRHHVQDRELAIPALVYDGSTYATDVASVVTDSQPKHYQPKWNDLQVARMKKAKKTGAIWVADQGTLPEALINEDAKMNEFGEAIKAPYFPEMLAVFDEASGELLFMETSLSDKDLYGNITKSLMSVIMKQGRPMTIRVRNDATEALLSGLCSKLNITLDRRKSIPELDDFRCDVHAQWMESQGFSEEEIDHELGKVFETAESVSKRLKSDRERTDMLESIADSLVEDPAATEEFVRYVDGKGIMSLVPDVVFDNLVDAVMLFDIDPSLEKLVKEEFRRRYYEDGYDEFDDGEDEY
ncbi:hypothetical protein D081_1484 [Anaerovibrio sp. JC8]|uniref:DUF6930 domain-containing protein n=1 Tax=Anaerovibrio sp. JC8 TaxID=1240085 RepID=UPI000A0D2F75|nr:hypothetical protein [Anaerovibrio sp. JC8]ORT99903.1 hypothetical protein D081_1484 [Anaerovibrio sp. JC8]